MFCATQGCQKGTARLLPRLEQLPWALITCDLGESLLKPEQDLQTVLNARGSGTSSREYACSVSSWNGGVEGGEDSL